MRVHPTTLTKIKALIKIEDVLQDFMPLKRKGSGHTLWGCCPFHKEKTPSFAVQAEKGFFKCFGCGKAGDTIHFLIEKEGMSYIESMQYLAEKYNIPWEEEILSDKEQEKYSEKEKLYILLELVVTYYQENLATSPEATQYLEARGISPQQINDFALGYSWNKWQKLYDFARNKGYTDEVLETVGLIIKKEKKVYDRFRGRLIFPLQDVTGRVIGLAGRLIGGNHEKQAKYINSPETPIYHKSRFLYGLWQAKKKIREKNHGYLVEGYTDVLAFHEAGITNVVASGGTSLAQDQILLFKRHADHITIVFDGDEAGSQATLRNIDLLLAQGIHVEVVSLPPGEDPDSLIKKEGKEVMQTYLANNSKDFLTFTIQKQLNSQVHSPTSKAKAIKNIINTLSKIVDSVQRDIYVKLASELIDVSRLAIQEEIRRIITQQNEYHNNHFSSSNKIELGEEKTVVISDERHLLHLFFNYGTIQLPDGNLLATYFLAETSDTPFERPQHQELIEAYKKACGEEKAISPQTFLLSLPKELVAIAADIMSHKKEISHKWEEKSQTFIQPIENTVGGLLHKNILRRKLKITNMLLRNTRLHLQSLNHEQGSEESKEQVLATYHALKDVQIEIGQQLGLILSYFNFS